MLPRLPAVIRLPGANRSSRSPFSGSASTPLRAGSVLLGCLLGFSSLGQEGKAPEEVSSETEPIAASPQAPESLPSDDAIIERLPEFSTEYLRDLLGIYARLRNTTMISALTEELRRRDPDKVLPRSDAALAAQAMDLDSGPPSPEELLENRIDALVVEKKYTEAIALMERERSENDSGREFPFEVELGDAYATLGNLAAARVAYGRAANSKTLPAIKRSLAEQGLATLDQLEAIEKGYVLIQEKKNSEALTYAEQIRRRYPDDPEAQLLYAQALVPNYHYVEALPMLESIRAKHFPKGPFPASDALAECLRAVGRFDEAEVAYRELASNATVPAHVREEAIVGAREVSRMRSGTFHGDAEFLTEDEGDAFLGGLEVSAPIGEKTFLGARAWAYSVSLSQERSLLQSSGSYYGATAFVRHYADNNLGFVEGRVGGGDHDDITWGVSLGKEAAYIGVLGYQLSVDSQIPAIDSLQMIVLNSTQDRIEGSVTLPLPHRLELYASAWGRQVQAGGVELGTGWGATLEIGRPIWENLTETKQVYLAYQGTYEAFDGETLSGGDTRRLGYDGEPGAGSGFAEELISPLYAPQGFQLTYEVRASPEIYYWAGAGLFFDFGDDTWEYNLTAGIDWALREYLSFYLEGGYYSDGVSAGTNSEVVVGTVGWRGFF